MEIAYVTKRPCKTPNLVLLGTRDEQELKEILSQIVGNGIAARPFLEPDLGNQMTAIATVPVYGEQRKIFKDWKLL